MLIDKAIKVLELMHLNTDERDEYENRLKWLRIEASTIEKAEAKAFQKGIEQGIEQGREEGINKRNLEIVKNMLSKNYSVSDISDLTGLSTSEIEKLKKSLS